MRKWIVGEERRRDVRNESDVRNERRRDGRHACAQKLSVPIALLRDANKHVIFLCCISHSSLASRLGRVLDSWTRAINGSAPPSARLDSPTIKASRRQSTGDMSCNYSAKLTYALNRPIHSPAVSLNTI